jgi:hypothetical protein
MTNTLTYLQTKKVEEQTDQSLNIQEQTFQVSTIKLLAV